METPFFDESGSPVDITEIQWHFEKPEGVWYLSAWSGALRVCRHQVPPEKLADALRTTELLVHAMAGFPQGFPVSQREAASQSLPEHPRRPGRRD
jgi:hypothetical protein